MNAGRVIDAMRQGAGEIVVYAALFPLLNRGLSDLRDDAGFWKPERLAAPDCSPDRVHDIVCFLTDALHDMANTPAESGLATARPALSDALALAQAIILQPPGLPSRAGVDYDDLRAALRATIEVAERFGVAAPIPAPAI